MVNVSILLTKTSTDVEAEHYKSALQALANNISLENIKLLASVATKPKINEKIQKKKTLIKTML